jgi:uncharacterized membrane protein YuzA (DUF378 family)
MKECCKGQMLACALVTIGALNWGLVGVAMLIGDANWNVVNLLIGSWSPTLEAIVYVLVGVAAIAKIAMCKASCKMKK